MGWYSSYKRKLKREMKKQTEEAIGLLILIGVIASLIDWLVDWIVQNWLGIISVLVVLVSFGLLLFETNPTRFYAWIITGLHGIALAVGWFWFKQLWDAIAFTSFLSLVGLGSVSVYHYFKKSPRWKAWTVALVPILIVAITGIVKGSAWDFIVPSKALTNEEVVVQQTDNEDAEFASRTSSFNSEVSSSKPAQQQQTPSGQTANQTTTQNEAKVPEEAVLGNSIEAFQQMFGEPGKQTGDFHQFQNGFVLVLTAGNRAFNITLAFESTGRIVSETEAYEEAKTYLPKDAKQVKTANQDGRKVYWFKSNQLKQKVGDENAVVILKYNDQGVYAAVIGVGDNP